MSIKDVDTNDTIPSGCSEITIPSPHPYNTTTTTTHKSNRMFDPLDWFRREHPFENKDEARIIDPYQSKIRFASLIHCHRTHSAYIKKIKQFSPALINIPQKCFSPIFCLFFFANIWKMKFEFILFMFLFAVNIHLIGISLYM